MFLQGGWFGIINNILLLCATILYTAAKNKGTLTPITYLCKVNCHPVSNVRTYRTMTRKHFAFRSQANTSFRPVLLSKEQFW